jgi:hypothetical protein
VLTSGVATLVPIKGFSGVVFSCLLFIFIVRRTDWDNHMKKWEKEASVSEWQQW